MPLAALASPILQRGFALRPQSVAQERQWCEHTYPRWGAHTSESTVTTLPVLGAPASIMGSELLQDPL
jgi:hypothetical protein